MGLLGELVGFVEPPGFVGNYLDFVGDSVDLDCCVGNSDAVGCFAANFHVRVEAVGLDLAEFVGVAELVDFELEEALMVPAVLGLV